MSVELIIPSVGESISEVQIGEWLKGVGDRVELDEPVVEIESAKVTVELPAPAAGVLTEISKQTGDDAEVGDVIGMIDPSATAATVRVSVAAVALASTINGLPAAVVARPTCVTSANDILKSTSVGAAAGGRIDPMFPLPFSSIMSDV